MMSLSYPKSVKIRLCKNNFMQISGSTSQILEFDLYFIIYLNFNNVTPLY